MILLDSDKAYGLQAVRQGPGLGSSPCDPENMAHDYVPFYRTDHVTAFSSAMRHVRIVVIGESGIKYKDRIYLSSARHPCKRKDHPCSLLSRFSRWYIFSERGLQEAM